MIDGKHWVLVDVGQVLIGFDHSVIGARLAAECFPPERQSAELPAAIEAFILGSNGGPSPNCQVDRGAKDIDWLCARICGEFGVEIAPAAFEDIWTSIFALRVNAEVVAYAEALRSEGVRIGICSNTNVAHWRFLRRAHPEFRRLVDEVRCFLSFELGKGKGDPGFFERIAELTGAPVGIHLLLDDRADYCDAARTAGMQAVRFDPADAARSLSEVTSFLHGGADHGE